MVVDCGWARLPSGVKHRRAGLSSLSVLVISLVVVCISPVPSWLGVVSRGAPPFEAGAWAPRVSKLSRRARGGFFLEEEPTERLFMQQAIKAFSGSMPRDGLRVLEWEVRDNRFLEVFRETIGVQPYYVADNLMDRRRTEEFPTNGPFEKVAVKYYTSEKGSIPLKRGLLDLVIVNELPAAPDDPLWQGTYDELVETYTEEDRMQQAERLSKIIPESYRMLKPTGRLVYFSAFGDDIPVAANKYFTAKIGQEDEEQGIRGWILVPKAGVMDEKPALAKKKRRRKVPLPADAAAPGSADV